MTAMVWLLAATNLLCAGVAGVLLRRQQHTIDALRRQVRAQRARRLRVAAIRLPARRRRRSKTAAAEGGAVVLAHRRTA